MNPVAAALVAVLVFVLPSAAEACAVCGGGTADNRFEFILTTGILTFLPLSIMFGVFWYFRRRYLAIANQAPPREGDGIPRIPVAGQADTPQDA